MEGKKISFGFMKTKKMEKPVVEEKKEFIECVEEHSIKIKGGEVAKEAVAPLTIPLKPNTLARADRLKQIGEKVEGALLEPVADKSPQTIKDEKPPENESLEQMAIRELLQDAKKEVKVETPALMVSVPAKAALEGQKESTLDDYESVPIQEFGIAMLRGMGWTPENQLSKYKLPELRPKGLGLGADKVVKDNQKKTTSKDKKEELTIVKNAFVKITTGKYSGCYGKVVSLDEENGRVMVDIPIKKETISLSEFMMQAVHKTEYDKESKVINADSFEEYKRNEGASKSKQIDRNNEQGSSKMKSHQRDEGNHRPNRDNENSDNGKSKNKQDSPSGDKFKKRQDRKRSDSSDSGQERGKKSLHRSPSKDIYRRYRNRSNSDEDRSKRRKEKKRTKSSDLDEDRSKSRRERKRDSSEESRDKSRRRHKKRSSSSDSVSSESDSERQKKHKKKCKSKKHSSSDSDSPERNKKEKKRDIDKKRKGKKKKRDRDRSPNYKKHRK